MDTPAQGCAGCQQLYAERLDMEKELNRARGLVAVLQEQCQSLHDRLSVVEERHGREMAALVRATME